MMGRSRVVFTLQCTLSKKPGAFGLGRTSLCDRNSNMGLEIRIHCGLGIVLGLSMVWRGAKQRGG